MAYLQIYQEWLLLASFLRVYSNSMEISYLPWQNKYPNLTCQLYLPYQAKFLLVYWTLKYLTPCKIPHVFCCGFKRCMFINHISKTDQNTEKASSCWWNQPLINSWSRSFRDLASSNILWNRNNVMCAISLQVVYCWKY